MSEVFLTVEGVTKKYGEFYALNEFSCEIPPGVTGLLGPNGAGKTTFIRCLLGILPFDGGHVKFQEWSLPDDLLKVKDLIGYQPEVDTQMHRTSAARYVTHFGRLAGLPRQAALQRAFDVLHYVGLEEARYRDLHTFSSGMLQRVKLATALVQDPLLLVLDEPTAGMDPQGRDQMLRLIHDLGHNHGKHILMSTHLLPDVERTSDYVVVISQGARVIQGDLRTILERKGDTVQITIRVSREPLEFAKILANDGFDVIDARDEITCMVNGQNDQAFLNIFKLARENDIDVRMVSPYRQRLEDVFLELVGENHIRGNGSPEN
jgi:ABC-2 type transport system ATP-binding protein